MKKTKTVEEYIGNNPERKEELDKLRSIILGLPFKEVVKWGMPVYTIHNKNLVGIGAFKDWSGIWFYQGALLNDPLKVLVNAQEGKTIAMRQWRFSNPDDIKEDEIIPYLEEVIANHKAGKTVDLPKPLKKRKELPIPELMEELFRSEPGLKKKFGTYTTAQRNDFINYINEPKREITKKDRLNKITSLIQAGDKLAALWTK
jgi:uncharacterized protein YdeI (YjbR/CyaY-like superfamily)